MKNIYFNIWLNQENERTKQKLKDVEKHNSDFKKGLIDRNELNDFKNNFGFDNENIHISTNERINIKT